MTRKSMEHCRDIFFYNLLIFSTYVVPSERLRRRVYLSRSKINKYIEKAKSILRRLVKFEGTRMAGCGGNNSRVKLEWDKICVRDQ